MSANRWVVGTKQALKGALPLGVIVWVAAGGAVGTGCGKAARVELQSPQTGQFMTLEQQRQLSTEQLETYCRMLDDYLAELRADVDLAKRIDDSLNVALDSLNDAQNQVNREARVIEAQLREMKQARRAATTYVTQGGDTLMKLSGLFYGTAADWRKIYEANREKIEDPGVELKAGITLTIP